MSPSVKKINSSGNMAYRSNQNRNRNFAGNYGGGAMGANRMNLSPWESQNYGGGNLPGQNVNAQVLNLANNLINNLVRTQNPPSLLDLPRGGGGGGMGGNRQRGTASGGRSGGGGGGGNRRSGFQGRNSGGRGDGGKSGQKQGGGGGGISKQNAFDRAKKLLAKGSSSGGNKKKEGGKRSEKTESPYADVPNEYFYCHLCKKHMWDADSFENHIKGRNHLTMREGVEESYRIKANMIRQEIKMAEQIKSIEMSRMKGKNRNLDYCTMCDLNFHGHISAHRKSSDGHLQLKKFLHPKCQVCYKEFPTRIDYDSHLLSPDHLKKAAERGTKVGEDRLVGLQLITEEEELKDVKPPQKKKKKTPKKSESGEAGAEGDEVKKEGEEGAAEGEEGGEKEGDEAEQKEGEEGAEESKEGEELNETQGEGEEEAALPVDPENCILDFQEGDEIPTDVDARLPKYNWTRPVGPGFINQLDCFECKLCGKFFDTEKTAEVHSRSMTHHRNFLKLINEKANETKIAEKRAAAAAAAQERKKRKLEEDEKKAAGGDDEKTNGTSAEGAEGELYDPSEATGDDVEMAENGEENGDGDNEGEGGEGEEEEGGDEDADKTDDKMDTQETEEKEDEKAEETKAETPKATKNAAAAAAAEESPAKKATPARGQAAKATPGRGRGRGRYTRY